MLIEFLPDAEIGFFEHGAMEEELVKLFGRRVDLIPKSGLKPIIRQDVLASSEVV